MDSAICIKCHLRKTDGATHNQPKICGSIHNAMGGFTKSEHPHMEDWSMKSSLWDAHDQMTEL